MKKIIISPSLLSADFNRLYEELQTIQNAGAEWLHFDVMDGHFVPNISFGLPVLKCIHNSHNMFNDVHIMVSDPKTYGPLFAKAGADLVTFHYEALRECEIEEVIKLIKDAGAKVGISIKPKTEVEKIYRYLSLVDLVLVMSVEPGFGGQSFIPSALDKISKLNAMKNTINPNLLIEVDGGINEITSRACIEKGADVLVAGSYLFNKEDVSERILILKGLK